MSYSYLEISYIYIFVYIDDTLIYSYVTISHNLQIAPFALSKMIRAIHYLVTKGTIGQIAPFSFKIECNLVLTKGCICQIAPFQSTHDLNSIGYKRCYVTYDTLSSQKIENLLYGQKSYLQKG